MYSLIIVGRNTASAFIFLILSIHVFVFLLLLLILLSSSAVFMGNREDAAHVKFGTRVSILGNKWGQEALQV